MISLTPRVRAIQTRQQLHIVSFVLDRESYVVRNGLVDFALAVDDSVGVGDDPSPSAESGQQAGNAYIAESVRVRSCVCQTHFKAKGQNSPGSRFSKRLL